MFSGITQGTFPIASIEKKPGLVQYSVNLNKALIQGLKIGASVAVEGVCQSVVRIEGTRVFFDAISETLSRTTVSSFEKGTLVNIERSLKFGDEIGGHQLSGHVYGTATIEKIDTSQNCYVVYFQCPSEWMRFILEKGYIAINGNSLTIVETDPSGHFSVHLIPETLRLSTLGLKAEGDLVNVELDAQTVAIVTSVERVLSQSLDVNANTREKHSL